MLSPRLRLVFARRLARLSGVESVTVSVVETSSTGILRLPKPNMAEYNNQ
jgi:hypothetical protein